MITIIGLLLIGLALWMLPATRHGSVRYTFATPARDVRRWLRRRA